MMRGVHELRLAPEQVWRSTLRELLPERALAPAEMIRSRMNELMRIWPDGT